MTIPVTPFVSPMIELILRSARGRCRRRGTGQLIPLTAILFMPAGSTSVPPVMRAATLASFEVAVMGPASRRLRMPVGEIKQPRLHRHCCSSVRVLSVLFPKAISVEQRGRDVAGEVDLPGIGVHGDDRADKGRAAIDGEVTGGQCRCRSGSASPG